jgi:hypothetical protein
MCLGKLDETLEQHKNYQLGVGYKLMTYYGGDTYQSYYYPQCILPVGKWATAAPPITERIWVSASAGLAEDMIIWIHFIADFLFQSDWMAVNKSKNSLLGLSAMATHISIYTMTLMVVYGVQFAITQGILHLVTDMVTSRATSYLWVKGYRHWFFVVIGLDQAIHLTCLLYL